MRDLDTIKRINRQSSKRTQPGNRQSKPAPQPTRHESRTYAFDAQWTLRAFREEMQSPAMDRTPLDG